MTHFRIGWRLFSAVMLAAALTAVVKAEGPGLTLYVPFDGGVDAKVAAGDAEGVFQGRAEQLQFVEGIRGQGLLTGALTQSVVFDAQANIPAGQWTITFWVKGLVGADWSTAKADLKPAAHEQFWQLFGPGGVSTRFYKYGPKRQPWLYTLLDREQKPRWIYVPEHEEQQWHFWAVTWRSDAGAAIFLDGRLVGEDRGLHAIPSPNRLVIGQEFGHDQANKIIDEFKVYDTALPPAAIQQAYWQEGDFALQPRMAVGPTRRTITIDGQIEPDEWQDATAFAGLIDLEQRVLAPTPTRGWLTYDRQYLYLALHSEMPAGVKSSPDTTVLHGFLKSDTVQHDASVNHDDSFGLAVIPRFPDGDLYRFYANGIGTTYEYRLPREGGVDLTWDPLSQVQSSVSLDGWSFEAAIPLAAFGIDRIEDGEVWRMDFSRVWQLLRQRTDGWASGERPLGEPPSRGSDLGVVQFQEQPAAVVQLERFELSAFGQAEAELALHNPGPQPRDLLVTLAVADEPVQQRRIALAPAGRERVALRASVQDAGGQLVTVQVTTPEGEPLFRQGSPLVVQQALKLNLWSYPSTQQLRLGWLIQLPGIDPDAMSLEAVLHDSEGQPQITRQLSTLPSVYDSLLMDVSSLPAGEYRMHVRVTGLNGVLHEQELTYEKQPLPEWFGNTLGLSDSPPPPWTDVEVSEEADSVAVWGRTYRYGGALLPTQIVNQGEEMLAGPMALIVAGADGQPTPSDTEEADDAQWLGVSAVRADTARSQVLGPVRVKTEAYVEFDGMTWVEMTVSPGDASTELRELTLEIPLKAKWAELINAYDYSLRETGALPKQGWRGTARPVWVGNGDGGIQFFQQTTTTWVGSREIEVVPEEDGRVVLRIHLVDEPVKLDQPRRFGFGWIASPVKPAPRNHRDWRIITGNARTFQEEGGAVGPYLRQAVQSNPELRVYSPWWQGWWWVPEAETLTVAPQDRGTVPLPKDHGLDHATFVTDYGLTVIRCPYGCLSQLGTANAWFAQFGDEWLPNANAVHEPNPTLHPALQTTEVSQAARSLRDFYAWGYQQTLAQGQVKGLYFDVSRPIYDNNIYHGAGVPQPGGVPAAEYNILGIRQTFRRIYTLLKAHDPDAILFYHQSGQALLPVQSFADAIVDGENTYSRLDRKDNRGYENTLTLGTFRAEYAGQNNFGPVSVMLPQFERSGAIRPEEWGEMGYGHAEHLMGLVLLHDSSIWWAYMPKELIASVYLPLDQNGWDATCAFIPYWRQDAIELPEDIKASFYVSPNKDRVFVVLMNVADHDQTLQLHVDGTKLGLEASAFAQGVSLYPDTPIVLDGQTLRGVSVPSHNFRVLMLTP